MAGVNQKAFRKFLDRDGWACVHCGSQGDDLVPQHRVNRGMGGSKVLNRPSNIVVLCAMFNGLVEADSRAAALALEHGWKLESWQIPEESPVWYTGESQWYFLDNEGNRSPWLDSVKEGNV